jgi:NAD+ synthase (glutamine-hydrolysing)
MKIALAQNNYIIGDFDHNVGRICDSIEKSKRSGAGLVVFAELSVCGYPPRDFLEFGDFISRCGKAVDAIAKSCHGITAIVGAPSVNPSLKGKPLYNTAFFLADGKVAARAHKTLLPNYDVFDEYRYFEPNRLPYQLTGYLGYNIAMTICEDLWNISDDPLYVRDPAEELAALHPDLIINIAASPFHYNQYRDRRDILKRNATKYALPVVYVNQVGGQTELLFDGDSMALSPGGEVVLNLERFREDLQIVELKALLNPVSQHEQENQTIAGIHDALVMGIRDYFHKMGFSRAILGLSGGIDSAVTLALAVKALGKENVLSLLLPSRYSSGHSIEDARKICETLGSACEVISIEEAFRTFESTLRPLFGDLPADVTEENIQARIRAVILMAAANKYGYILLNTSNKSEAAVGYGTLYGDMCGGISVLGDVYKTQIYDLAAFINREREVIPENTILKPPSAELRPGQKDSDSLPGYEILDRILVEYIEHRKGPDELIRAGFDPSLVRRVLRMVNMNEWKRHQTPPILRISPKAFGTGRRMPIVARYLS